MVNPGQRFTRDRPCPICGGTERDQRGQGKRCHGFVSGDGKYVHCTREEHAGSLTKYKDDTYAHRLTGKCRCGKHHGVDAPPTFITSKNGKAPHAEPEKPPRRLIKTTRYEIRDPDSGELLAVHLRKDYDDNTKWVGWEGPDGMAGLGGTKVEDLPLYGASKLRDAPDHSVLVVEGEKAQIALSDAGVLAVGTVTGADGAPSEQVLRCLEGRKVILWADNDEKGQRHMGKIADRLLTLEVRARKLVWDEAPPKGDAWDYFALGGTAEQLRERIANAPPWKAQGLKTITAAELLSLEMPPLRWAVSDLVPEGLTILAGRPKLGKSWLALGLAIAVSSGGKALGFVDVDPGQVLYLALEDGKRRLQSRLRTLLGSDAPPECLEFRTQWPRLGEGGAEELEIWIQDHPEARLIIVDTFKRIRPKTKGNRQLYDEDYDAMTPLADLVHRYPIAIIVVMHTRKMDADDPLDLISGSTGTTANVDGALVLKRDRGSADAALHFVHRDGGDAIVPLLWDATTCSWIKMGEKEQQQRQQLARSKERNDVLRLLHDRGPLGPKDISVTLKRTYNATKVLLHAMSQAGEVQSDAGKYSPLEPRPSGPPSFLTTTNPPNHTNPPNPPNHANHGDGFDKRLGGLGAADIAPNHAGPQKVRNNGENGDDGKEISAVSVVSGKSQTPCADCGVPSATRRCSSCSARVADDREDEGEWVG
jgi:hypothetical protein